MKASPPAIKTPKGIDAPATVEGVSLPASEPRPRTGRSGDSVDATEAPRLKSALETVGVVVAPITLVSALLYYFGWVRSNSLWLYFGIDQSTLGFSSQDYLLRSVSAVFIPLGVLIGFALLVLEGHNELMHWVRRRHHPAALAMVALVVAILGVGFFGIGMAGEAGHPLFGLRPILTPLGFALGVSALSYGAHLRKRHRAMRHGSPPPGAGFRRLASLQLTFIVALVTLGMFWALGDWADAVGRGKGQELAREIPNRPGVIVYSKQPLNLDGSGIQVQEVGSGQSIFPFRYTGLKLLIHSGGKYFLVPVSWSRFPVTIVLPDSDSWRLEFTPQ